MTRLVNAIKQLPTSGSELAKIAEALGWDMDTLVNSTEAERAAAVAAMDAPTLAQSGVREKRVRVIPNPDLHAVEFDSDGNPIAATLPKPRFKTVKESYSTDQDYADYAE